MLVLLLVLAAAALLATWAHAARRVRRVSAGLDLLREGVRSLARGDAPREVPSAGGRDLDALTREFNQMAAGVRQRQHDLERSREETDRLLNQLISSREHHLATLEEKVRERTSDLHKAYEELKKLDEMKDSFLSSVSHELRTPLSSIRSFSEILLTYNADEATRRDFLGIINQESERLTRLINDVLDLAKIEAGRMEWHIAPISLAQLCDAALAPLHVLARKKGQRLVVNVPAELPLVLADRDRLIQVFGNLIANAVKFTGEGGSIHVGAGLVEAPPGAQETDMVRVEIRDNGIGIPGGDIKLIFEKFKQVGDTLTGKPTGTGLGLPISRDIIRQLGGALWCESAPGEGSRFQFTLRVATPERAPDQAGVMPQGAVEQVVPACAPPRQETAFAVRGRRRLVGVADDDAGTVGVLRELLSLRGYEVLTAADGVEAIEIARGNELELMILDLNMPRKSGWRVLEELRSEAQTKDLPVIVLTGMEAEMDRARALALGAVEFLEKGRGLERLTAEIDLLVQGSV